ncbi:MAG: hypothetical protein ABL898_17030 [Hyphomicrobiaceae bacterium]|nr:hypothetical protein [Hyphomicrobiaceae bacterium]
MSYMVRLGLYNLTFWLGGVAVFFLFATGQILYGVIGFIVWGIVNWLQFKSFFFKGVSRITPYGFLKR